MMVRLLAFALHADDALTFGRGLSTDDEPDVWRRDLTGAIEQWIEVGLPEAVVDRFETIADSALGDHCHQSTPRQPTGRPLTASFTERNSTTYINCL